VLDGITVGGNSSVDVTVDGIVDSVDSYWQLGGSGGSVNTIVAELAGFAGTNTFGIFDLAVPGVKVQVFSGPDAPGSSKLISMLADGSVLITDSSGTVDTGIDFASNTVGFYLDATAGNADAGAIWHSDTSLNTLDGADHMAAFEGTGDQIQIPPFAAGPWTQNEYILAFEDLIMPVNAPEPDYTDFVVLVESVRPIPEPLSVFVWSLLGLTMIGAVGRRRRRA
jgi:hypothetical protein